MGLIPRELGSTIVDLRVSFCTNTILNKKQGKKERKGKGRGGIGSEKRKSRRGGGRWTDEACTLARREIRIRKNDPKDVLRCQCGMGTGKTALPPNIQ